MSDIIVNDVLRGVKKSTGSAFFPAASGKPEKKSDPMHAYQWGDTNTAMLRPIANRPRQSPFFVRELFAVSAADLSPDTRHFISRYVRSIEQLEILLLFSQEPETAWTVQKVYERVLSTPQSVERWLASLVQNGLLKSSTDPEATYECCSDDGLREQVTLLAEAYRILPVRVLEAIYSRESGAAKPPARTPKANP